MLAIWSRSCSYADDDVAIVDAVLAAAAVVAAEVIVGVVQTTAKVKIKTSVSAPTHAYRSLRTSSPQIHSTSREIQYSQIH